MKKIVAGLVLFLGVGFTASAQEVIDLYPGNIPNAKVKSGANIGNLESGGLVRRIVKPSLEVYLPAKENASGAAVIICPGGSYKVIVFQGEGVATAKAFAQKGVAAFVLKYRLPNDTILTDKKIGPLQDAQQAIKYVRENAARYGIEANKIGIVGFSAGGHLASTAATHFEKPLIPNPKNTNLRPDFQVLVYPVISMQDGLTHADSRSNLLGKNPTKETIDLFSNELQVTKNAPPAYITHAADDKLVDVDNSIVYFQKLRHQNIAVEMHIYPKGGHGFIFGQKDWIDPLFLWMRKNKWMK
ncbi:alpha/beta hydrolase [Adhaeribacter rhizoryzae]|uniref:Alpha/beta hydrolase n=1 Tax=Adhaeribacter rhizoryzae TaxID=2607907 RepID=A0A5M6DP36_9BACT|nr:alpha/beta hydrolase [Adhaeribacter rhizoryzae]KAA5548002.1 alpha/beta hydrolase [Adhaeribacter rhizoryzae]